MRAPTSEQHQKNTDLLGWQAEERFEVRRAAERRRGATLALTRKPKDVSGRSASTPRRTSVPHHHLPPTPWLLAIVVGSLGVLFVLAVIGAWTLIRAVFGG